MTHNLNIRRGTEARFTDRPIPPTDVAIRDLHSSPCPANCAAEIDAGWRDRRRWIREIQEGFVTRQSHLQQEERTP